MGVDKKRANKEQGSNCVHDLSKEEEDVNWDFDRRGGEDSKRTQREQSDGDQHGRRRRRHLWGSQPRSFGDSQRGRPCVRPGKKFLEETRGDKRLDQQEEDDLFSLTHKAPLGCIGLDTGASATSNHKNLVNLFTGSQGLRLMV